MSTGRVVVRTVRSEPPPVAAAVVTEGGGAGGSAGMSGIPASAGVREEEKVVMIVSRGRADDHY
ncbi:hypothetical protein SHKM778_52530 [Streptomyces sp. KM77-8]|uniref:Uncharacterized protein n=1 Tax=Streptomyces haneummycinicus TaxID=3074435 RepID=A0AAT9HP69_9ACTN